jgi:glycosyltransferase involved in cell wall biosynthesis
VLHVHGSAFDDFVLTRSQAVGALQQLVFRASDEVIVLSEYWKDVVSHRVEREKIRVIPNAVRPDVFPVDDERTTPHVVFVSNLIERKGVLELVSAVERLSDRASGDFEVTIAGDGPLSASVERLADEYDEVTYLGYVSEERKRTLLRDGSIYVLPTYAEGLPIALLEGMAGGNAVVSTAVGSIPEVIDECNGILVEPGEVDELADALAELITDRHRRARMAERNRELIETRYSWDRVRTELVNAYRSNTGS